MNIAELKTFATSIGFDRVGVTTADPPHDFQRYLDWTKRGFAADLWYLTEPRRVEKRGDLQKILPGARSVIACATSYAPREGEPTGEAKIARYARGEDYHHVLKSRLEELADWLKAHASQPFEYLSYVDTGPILERSLAERAGVGWIGKNSCVIDAAAGSYLLLGELITTLDLPADAPAINRCGTCTRCLDACPTGALVAEYQLDAGRCISYQTIEQRADPIPAEVASHQGEWVAGCDICQEVCPWNQEPLTLRLEEFRPLSHSKLSLLEVAELDQTQFTSLFGNTSLRRIGLNALKRNAKSALQGGLSSELSPSAIALKRDRRIVSPPK